MDCRAGFFGGVSEATNAREPRSTFTLRFTSRLESRQQYWPEQMFSARYVGLAVIVG